MNKYTIYRVNLEDFTAAVWKEYFCSQEHIDKEMRKLNEFLKKNDHPTAFILREDRPTNHLIIPVL